MKHGHYYTGICKGVRMVPRTNNNTGEQKQVYLVGLSSPVTNGYENQERIFEIELGKKAVAAGIHNQFDDFKDKLITLPIYQSNWMSNNGIKTNTYYGSLSILDVVVIDNESLKQAV